MMTQFSAKQYTKFLSLLTRSFYRLPTEAEWEYACRAGTTTAYSYGEAAESLVDYGWFLENSDEHRHAVGQKKPNAWGVFDMHGNVAEWTLDQYSQIGYADRIKQTDNPSLNVNEAFHQPTKRSPLCLRGGGFLMEAAECRSASRFASERGKTIQPRATPATPWVWFHKMTKALKGRNKREASVMLFLLCPFRAG